VWESERDLFAEHFRPSDRILDIGCGAGRTTFGLYGLGYRYVRGVDMSEAMIRAAGRLNGKKGIKIPFDVGNALALAFPDGSFDAALFMFNGFMQIPGRPDRIRALREIGRVLRDGGVFVFTTPDRDRALPFLAFWKEERKRWDGGKQDPRILEFGDRIIDGGVEKRTFVHICDRGEVLGTVDEAGFEVVEDVWRPERWKETGKVMSFSTECRMWVVRKRRPCE
jgi:SAM-dependent methyltransferase